MNYGMHLSVLPPGHGRAAGYVSEVGSNVMGKYEAPFAAR